MEVILAYHCIISLLVGLAVAFEIDGRHFRTRFFAGMLSFVLWPLILGALISDALKKEPGMKAMAMAAHQANKEGE